MFFGDHISPNKGVGFSPPDSGSPRAMSFEGHQAAALSHAPPPSAPCSQSTSRHGQGGDEL